MRVFYAMRIWLQGLFYALRILFFEVLSTHDMERMPRLGSYKALRLPWMLCIHGSHLDHPQWASPVVAADPCGTRHPANEEAQQGIARNRYQPGSR
jgi:hypothetical protein